MISMRIVASSIAALAVSLSVCAAVIDARAEEPFQSFKARATFNVKHKDGSWRSFKADMTHANAEAKRIKERITAAKEFNCNEAPQRRTDSGGPLVVIPTFSLKSGGGSSAYWRCVSKSKKRGVTFKVRSSVGATGVTG